MKIKLEVVLEVDDNFVEEAKHWEHHADRLLDLESYPEIKGVSNCVVKEVTCD